MAKQSSYLRECHLIHEDIFVSHSPAARSIKVITIVGLIILGIVLDLGGISLSSNSRL